ncbi:MAG: NlpC/P60 family protein [bacterium]
MKFIAALKTISINSIIRHLWVDLLIAVFICLLIFPVGTRGLRYFIIIGGATLVVSGFILHWKNLYFRYLLVVVCLVSLLIITLPGRKADSAELRKEYISSLSTYTNVTYVWGGENHLGIDCSGLVREGMVDANRSLGIKTLNMGLLRRSFYIWWNDCTARDLGTGYRQMTRPVLQADSMDVLDYSKLLPGDILVNYYGVHTFAYLGDQQWIESTPEKWKVVKVSAKDKAKEYSGIKIKIVRWSELGE